MKVKPGKYVVTVFLLLILLFLPHAMTAGMTPQANTYSLDWHVISSGGTTFTTAGSYSLGATIGQPQAGRLNASNLLLNVGFWVESFVNQYLPIVLR